MTVYVLFNGEYSDERMVGVYSSRANAELAGRIFSDDAHIEECEIDAMVDVMSRGYVPFFVRLNRISGDVMECHEQSSDYGAFSRAVGEDIHRNLYTHCWAPNRGHAVKIAADRRRAFLAGEPMPADAVDPVEGIVESGPRALKDFSS